MCSLLCAQIIDYIVFVGRIHLYTLNSIPFSLLCRFIWKHRKRLSQFFQLHFTHNTGLCGLSLPIGFFNRIRISPGFFLHVWYLMRASSLNLICYATLYLNLFECYLAWQNMPVLWAQTLNKTFTPAYEAVIRFILFHTVNHFCHVLLRTWPPMHCFSI